MRDRKPKDPYPTKGGHISADIPASELSIPEVLFRPGGGWVSNPPIRRRTPASRARHLADVLKEALGGLELTERATGQWARVSGVEFLLRMLADDLEENTDA